MAYTNRMRACDNPQRSLRGPAALLRLQQVIGHGVPHERCDEADLARLLSDTTRYARRAQKHGTAWRLPRKALEETIDNQTPEAVAHEVHDRRPQRLHEALQACGNLRHGGVGRRVPKRMHLQTELIRKPATQGP